MTRTDDTKRFLRESVPPSSSGTTIWRDWQARCRDLARESIPAFLDRPRERDRDEQHAALLALRLFGYENKGSWTTLTEAERQCRVPPRRRSDEASAPKLRADVTLMYIRDMFSRSLYAAIVALSLTRCRGRTSQVDAPIVEGESSAGAGTDAPAVDDDRRHPFYCIRWTTPKGVLSRCMQDHPSDPVSFPERRESDARTECEQTYRRLFDAGRLPEPCLGLQEAFAVFSKGDYQLQKQVWVFATLDDCIAFWRRSGRNMTNLEQGCWLVTRDGAERRVFDGT